MTASPQTQFRESVSLGVTGRRLKQVRELLELSQERLARKFQGATEGEPLTRRALMKWEDGESSPTIPRLLRLVEVLKEEGFCLPDQVVFGLYRASEEEWQRLYGREVAWKTRGRKAARQSIEKNDALAVLRKRCNWYWEWLCEREEERLLSEVSLPFDIPDAVFDRIYELAVLKADEEWEDPATWNTGPVDWDRVFKHSA